MPEGGRQGDSPLTQRGAYFGSEQCETSQNSRWLYQPELYEEQTIMSRPSKRKKSGYTQIRLYLPNDTCRKLLKLPPRLRSTILSMRLRAMDWGMEFDPTALQDSCSVIKESTAILRQAVIIGLIQPEDKEAFDRLVYRLEKVVQT